MKKTALIALVLFCCASFASAQKYALVDMEYILKNIPAYERANEQLNQSSRRWQAEVASRQIPGTINHLAFCPGVVDMSPAQMRPVDEVCATVMQMLDQASALGPVLLICPPPVKEPAMRQRIASLCEAYVSACARKGHPCADVHAALAASPEYMDDLEDGLHPGPQGAALMARLLAEDPAVRRFFLTAKQED